MLNPRANRLSAPRLRSVLGTRDFLLLDDSTAIGRVRSAVSEGHPFSLIRLGDGEGVVLSYGNDMWLQDIAYLHGHWGAESVPLGAIAQMRNDLEAAIASADVVGVRPDVIGLDVPDDILDLNGSELRTLVLKTFPIRPQEVARLSSVGARRLALLQRTLGQIAWREEQEFCGAWIHWELLATGALAEILNDVDEVGLVTARAEIQPLIEHRFGVRARVVAVPDKHVDTPNSGAHVPTRYQTIRSDFDFLPGTLVLVGAGIPGKVYCSWLKEMGCVAVDIGAVFDAWVGKASRPRVFESRFKVPGGLEVPTELQLHHIASDNEAIAVPRWKPSGLSR